jgi:hypothetical protein
MNINQLPLEIIINNIIPYTYNIQSKNLLVDIRSFYIDYNIIDNIYTFDYNNIILLRDLLFFTQLNKYEKLINIIKKHIFFNNDSIKASNYIINNFETNIKLNIDRKIKFLFGLMTPIQRTRFINTFINY